MNKNNKLVPKLRFPEFVNEGEWNEPTLGEISDRIENKVGTRKLTTVSISAGVGFVSQAEKFSRDISGQQYKNYIVLKKGEFSYNKGNSKKFPQGCIYKLKEFDEVAAPNAFISFKFKDNYNGDFYQGYFDNNYHGSQLQKFITSGARMDGLLNISANDFFTIKFPTPKNPDEQQKIASCLSSLDELISAHSDKLDALKDHKKGVMQELFPAEGETVPKLRFKEFEGVGEWEYFDGNVLFEPITNKNHNSDLPILAVTQNEGAIPRDLINYTVIATDQSIESYKVVEVGDFIISLRSFQGGIEYSNYKGICSPAYIILRNKIDLVRLFFKYYFKTDLYIYQLNVNLEGIRDGKMVSYKQFSEIKLPLPAKNEQQKIANFLLSIDEKITAQVQKIEGLKEYKKGLLQGLFPYYK
jgi:type I restriction enzyme, S subunit